MSYATCEFENQRRIGEIDDDTLVPLRGLTEIGLTTSLSALEAAERITAERIPVEQVHLLPVVPNPSKVICVGLNYADHIAEKPAGKPRPTQCCSPVRLQPPRADRRHHPAAGNLATGLGRRACHCVRAKS